MSSWACRASQEESKNLLSEEYDPKMVKKDRHYDDYTTEMTTDGQGENM